jgi:thioredoxin reductase
MTSTVLSTVIWGSAALVAGSILSLYLGGVRRRERRDRERAAEAERLGISKPAGQYPYVDPSICIGCGACIRACPEGDVLGIVGGLAVVIDGARCIGIGACAKACPVEGIELAMGDLRGRADVPQMDERNQTNVPGLFVAGELGGLALIRNAIGQGRDTVRWIAAEAARIRPGPTSDPLDLAIVGAGPAGLSAALAAVEAGLSYAVFEQETSLGGTIHHYPRRKLTHTQPVEIPLHGALTKGEYSKEELLELFGELVSRHRLAVRFDHKVLDVSRLGDGFQLTTTSGLHRARFTLLTLGRRGTPRKLGVPGEELGKVMYQVRDADHYRGRRILCIGGGDSAIEAAIGLARQPGSEVALSYRGERFHRVKRRNQELLENLTARGRIRPLLGSQVRTIEDHQVRLDTPAGELVLDNDFVFVLIGGEPPFPLLRQAGIRFGNEAA